LLRLLLFYCHFYFYNKKPLNLYRFFVRLAARFALLLPATGGERLNAVRSRPPNTLGSLRGSSIAFDFYSHIYWRVNH